MEMEVGMELVTVIVVVLVAIAVKAVIAPKTTPCLSLDTKSFVFLIANKLFYKILRIIPHKNKV